MPKVVQGPKRLTDALVQAHEAHSSIRAQGKRAAGLPANGMSGMNKDVVKAVLASPLIVPWPAPPAYLQTSVLRTLASMIPASVADYHVARARCQRTHKRKERKKSRAVAGKGTEKSAEAREDALTEAKTAEGKTTSGVVEALSSPKHDRVVAMDVDEPGTAAATDKESQTAPHKPDELRNLTIGITEITKHLEAQTLALRLRIQSLASPISSNLIPTAPLRASPPPTPSQSENPFLPSAARRSPLRFVIVPLADINPPTLVAHIPQYCATHNALVRQWRQVAAGASMEEPAPAPQEVTLVTTAKNSEMTLAELVGLRRVACLGITTTYRGLEESLNKLLPTSVLVPPRHVFTLPAPASSQLTTSAAYIPLHIKAIHTTMPANGKEKKQARLDAVREKRKTNKVLRAGPGMASKKRRGGEKKTKA